MRNISLRMLQSLFVALLLLALAGCGANNSNIAGTPGDSSISAKLAWPGGSAKSTAKAVASTIPGNVASINMTVTGAGVPVVKNVVQVTSSTPASTTITGITPGTVTLVVQALDANKVVLFEGSALYVVVTNGNTTNVPTINMTPPVVKAENVSCVGCHENTTDVTGQNLLAQYKESGHYTNTDFNGPRTSAFGSYSTSYRTGCVGCHGPSHNIQDPAADGTGMNSAATNGTNVRCFDCHNIGGSNQTLVTNHGTYYLANGNSCSSCHQVHNTAAANMERKTWAQSRHGATDFANMAGGASATATGNCANRCHNPQGFITAVNKPTQLVQGNLSVQSQQMITCNACHSDAARGILRTLAGTNAGSFATYTSSSSKGYQFAPGQKAFNPKKNNYYPDVAGSNLCIICHSGTTEGTTASPGLSDPYFANSSTARSIKKSGTITQHNMPAAAVMYVKFGFMNLSTGTNGTTQAYLNGLTSDIDGNSIAGTPNNSALPGLAAINNPKGYITSTHRKFGTSAIAYDSHFSASNPAPANFLTNGPCAVCHVSGSHTFKIDQAAVDAVCSHCHTSENGNDITNISAFKQYFLDPQQEVYQNAIKLGATIINKKVADYNATPAGIATPLKFIVGIDPMTSSQPGKIVLFKYWLDGTNGTTNAPYAADGTINVSSSNSQSSTYVAPGSANANYLSPAATTAPYYQADLVNAAIALGYSQTAGDVGYTKFIGAISNLAFFAKDNGGFAHARTYSRRLIYDSLDFLANTSLQMGVSTAAIALSNLATIGGVTNPVYGLYTKGSAAYNTNNGAITAPATGTSESMLYLIGWNRTTGAWTTPERP